MRENGTRRYTPHSYKFKCLIRYPVFWCYSGRPKLPLRKYNGLVGLDNLNYFSHYS